MELKKEKACGCIIVENGKVLTVRQLNGNCGFPKGHVEEGETELETAIREVREETGLDVEIDYSKRYVMNYTINNKVEKEVVLFKAKKIGGELKKQDEEIESLKWVSIDKAFKEFSFDTTRDIFRKFLDDSPEIEELVKEKKTKKKRIALIICTILACLVLYCVVAYTYMCKLDKSQKNVSKEEVITDEALYTLDTYPKVDASLATQPLTNAFIKNFTADENLDTATIEYSNTHPAYVKLINDEVDLIVVTEPSDEELALAKEKGVELEVISVVKEGFVFYVNSENKVDSLTTDQIQGIYSGEIKNWKDVGGDDEEIKAYQRPTNSGSQTGMLSLVMKNKSLMQAPTENLIDTMEAIINKVSSYDNGKNAIGYSYYYYATTMFETIDKTVASNIKLLGVNGIKPTNETIKNSSYPYTTAYYIVINKADNEDSASRKLANYMLSARGQKVAENTGYVPVK